MYRGVQLVSSYVWVFLLMEDFSLKSYFDTMVPKPEEQDGEALLPLTFPVGLWMSSWSVSWLCILLLEHLSLPVQLLLNLNI